MTYILTVKPTKQPLYNPYGGLLGEGKGKVKSKK
jgi:hypothetical protein